MGLDQRVLQRTGAVVTVGQLPVLAAHPALLRQVFGNLIGNAVKYVAAGVAPQVAVTARQTTSGWSFAVADNGIGIPAAARRRVFRLFHRETSSGYEGTGIGLTTCKRIVERHGGTMGVEPAGDTGDTRAAGNGSVFTFTIPAAVPTALRSTVPTQPAGVSEPAAVAA